MSDKATLLAAALTQFRQKLLAALALPVRRAGVADNTDSLSNKSRAQLEADAAAQLTSHRNQANPHNVKIEDLGGMTRPRIDSLVGSYLRKGTFPLSLYESTSARIVGNKLIIVNPILVLSGLVFNYDGEAEYDLGPLVNGTAYHLTMLLREGSIHFNASTSVMPENETCMWVKTFTKVSGTVVLSSAVEQIKRLDSLRLSSVSAGSSFLHTRPSLVNNNPKMEWYI